MSSTQSKNRSHKPGAVISFLLLMLGALATSQAALNIQENMSLNINDPRPVAKAVRTLEDLCHCVVTYEDPRLINAAELKDITDELRGQRNQSQTVAVARIIVPKGGAFTVTYNPVRGREPQANIESVLQEILKSHDREVGAGKFRIEKGKDVFHVIPIAVKNANGVFTSQTSVLDTKISLPMRERSGFQMLDAICRAVSNEQHKRLEVATAPMNLFLQNRTTLGFSNEKARDVLIKFLQNVDQSGRLSWQLLYEPGMKTYALNIHRVE
jgi:hypothetical protein